MRPPLQILSDLSTILAQLDLLKFRRSKLISEAASDPTITSAQLADFLSLAKIPTNDTVAVVADFETLHGGAQQK